MDPTEEELKELERLNSITEALWIRGKETNWESMTHTKTNADRTDLHIRSRNITGFMNMQIKNKVNNTTSKLNSNEITKEKIVLRNIGMMF